MKEYLQVINLNFIILDIHLFKLIFIIEVHLFHFIFYLRISLTLLSLILIIPL